MRFLSKKGRIWAIAGFVSVLLFLAPASVSAQILDSFFNPKDISELFPPHTLQSSFSAGAVSETRLSSPELMQSYYARRNYKPFWIEEGALKDHAGYFIQVIEAAWQHGLNPYQYNLEEMRNILNQPNPVLWPDIELLLTDAFIRYYQDMSGMRVNASDMRLRPQDWRQRAPVQEALEVLFSGADPEKILNDILPRSATYQALQKELVRLVNAPHPDYEKFLPIRFQGLVKPAMRHKNIPALRSRLSVQPQTEDPLLYDDRLTAAVMRFQRENGLVDDGIIGPNTLEILNQSIEDKILQIIANMERIRWMGHEKPDRYVIVNIPSATLWAVENGSIAFDMRVVVGRPKRPTLSFITEIRGMRFNPDWTVPPTIKRDDIWPRLQEDPNYLYDKGMELYYGYGADAETLDPFSIDWVSLSSNDLHQFRMVQVPGSHNPLGRFRVLMPNQYNIYLHDTNEKHYFESAARALSSGCVRMAAPRQMASFIMKGQKGWDESRIDSVLGDFTTRDVAISDPVPVYLLYYTAWVDENGRIIFGNDIYDWDQELINLLSKVDGYFIPRHNENIAANSGHSEFAKQ